MRRKGPNRALDCPGGNGRERWLGETVGMVVVVVVSVCRASPARGCSISSARNMSKSRKVRFSRKAAVKTSKVA